MANNIRFDYVSAHQELAVASYMPLLPLRLHYEDKSIDATGLLDSGATVNVLPYYIGERLGAVWDSQPTPLRLSGNLANLESRALLVNAQIADYDEVQLAFAWTQSNDVPLILGQVNFFMVYDVCFYRAKLFFEINPRV